MSWQIDVGLEVHVELNTASKIFCSCSTAFGAGPNSLCCPVCTGHPGALPVFNKKVLEYAVRTGLALGCEIADITFFDRKNYFYPDQPRGYQISQLYATVCRGGGLEIDGPGGSRLIPLIELHMEDDAGKLVYGENGELYIDYNRSGVPLLEIVTAPELHSDWEVSAFLEELIGVLRAIGVSDCRMQEGSMRVDVNLSVRRKGESLGTRTEMKNLSSLRSVRQAIRYESKRQIEILESGGNIENETRRWDEDRGISLPMRAKEEKEDYRYFPDPDLPPVKISRELLETQRGLIPELPRAKRRRYMRDFMLPEQDCRTLTADISVAKLFEETVSLGIPPLEASKWICGDYLRLMKEGAGEHMTAEKLARIITMVSEGMLTRANGRQVLEALFYTQGDPDKYAEEKGLFRIDDRNAVEKAVREIMENFPVQVEECRAGKQKLMDFLMGQVMRKLEGRGDPSLIMSLLNNAIFQDKQ
ncbi:MAG TPA: Asp-tRNA(Asn)/Glu-tRNA(Gln) amidotransferase subunit GatB [Clostridiales bacterium]|nr:Asp-tRNA(Asn)/Glu-tRNA(Gln) amidotransferase subunit GatB [Clostridiales bacterium]